MSFPLMLMVAIVIDGQTLPWAGPDDNPCEFWASAVEALVSIEPERRRQTAMHWAALRPKRSELFRIAYQYVEKRELTQQNGYVLAYRECSV